MKLFKIIQPVSLTLTGICIFTVWIWISMTVIDYRPGAPFVGLKTAGWFYLGIPFWLVIALILTLPFTFASRKLHTSAGWATMLTSGLLLIGFAFYWVTPHARLANALKIELPPETELTRLRSTDTFNAGTHIYGIVSCNAATMQTIVDTNSLAPHERPLQRLSQSIGADSLPEYGVVFTNDFLSCYHDSDNNKLYFYSRSDRPHP